MTAAATTPVTLVTAPSTESPRRLLGAVPLVVGALTIAVLLLVVPWGERNEIDYAAVSPIRDAFWAGVLVDGLAMAAVGIGLALVVCRLVPGKGRRWADAGAVLTVTGSILFALGGFAYATLAWHATDSSAVDPAAGAALLDRAVESPQHSLLLQIAGFLTFTLGTVLVSVALLRSGAVTRWLPGVILVTTVLVFVSPPRVKDGAQAVQMLTFGALALLSLRDRSRV